MMQEAIAALLVIGSAWYVFGALAPWRQRRLRAWLARRLDGHLPAAVIARLRPGLPAGGCGCGSACSGVSQSPVGPRS